MCSQVIASNVPRADVLETIVKDDVLRISYVSKQYYFMINQKLIRVETCNGPLCVGKQASEYSTC